MSDDASCGPCSTGLCRVHVPLAGSPPAGEHGLAASGGCLATDGPPTAAPADGSPVLILACPPVGRVAGRARLRAALNGPRVATEAVPGALATLSQGGKLGRPVVAKEIQALIKNISPANPTWGSPGIVGVVNPRIVSTHLDVLWFLAEWH